MIPVHQTHHPSLESIRYYPIISRFHDSRLTMRSLHPQENDLHSCGFRSTAAPKSFSSVRATPRALAPPPSKHHFDSINHPCCPFTGATFDNSRCYRQSVALAILEGLCVCSFTNQNAISSVHRLAGVTAEGNFVCIFTVRPLLGLFWATLGDLGTILGRIWLRFWLTL